jgi:Mitochondrial K+-H+ exchange-related
VKSSKEGRDSEQRLTYYINQKFVRSGLVPVSRADRQSRSADLKVFLLHLDQEHSIFYSEGPETLAEAVAEHPSEGIRGWAEKKYNDIQRTLTESEQGIGLKMRRAWEWLQKRTDSDELLLRALRGAAKIRLHHSTETLPETAIETWNEYLARRNRKHITWLTVNAITVPFTLLLAPIPGPNIIGYWFLYRAFCHVFAIMGLRRARDGELKVECFDSECLDGYWSNPDEKQVGRLASRYGLTQFHEFVRRNITKRPPGPSVGLSPSLEK